MKSSVKITKGQTEKLQISDIEGLEQALSRPIEIPILPFPETCLEGVPDGVTRYINQSYTTFCIQITLANLGSEIIVTNYSSSAMTIQPTSTEVLKNPNATTETIPALMANSWYNLRAIEISGTAYFLIVESGPILAPQP